VTHAELDALAPGAVVVEDATGELYTLVGRWPLAGLVPASVELRALSGARGDLLVEEGEFLRGWHVLRV
jgi:hypothetical protein